MANTLRIKNWTKNTVATGDPQCRGRVYPVPDIVLIYATKHYWHVSHLLECCCREDAAYVWSADLPIVWDFAEVVPIADAPGDWNSGYELIEDVARM